MKKKNQLPFIPALGGVLEINPDFDAYVDEELKLNKEEYIPYVGEPKTELFYANMYIRDLEKACIKAAQKEMQKQKIKRI